MKIVALLIIVGLTLGSVAEAKQLANGKRISISALQKLLGTQATPVLTADDAIKQYEYFYYTNNRLEWLEIADKKINMQLTLAEVKFLDNDYTLDGALQDNHFYMARYRHEDQSSVRYLRELREALNGKLSEKVRDELRLHNLGEILLTPASLAEIAADIDPTQQRRWQAELAELTEPEREQVIRLTGIDKRIKTETETKTDVKPSPYLR